MSADPQRHNDVGRPRDETIDDRVMQETIHIFGARGWSKLSIDRVAYAAGVGKASIYLRWKSKEELVLATIDRLGPKPLEIDTGSLDGNLRSMIVGLIDLYRSDAGKVSQRVQMDVDLPPALRERLLDTRFRQVQSWRSMMRNMIELNWVREDTPIGTALNMIHGTVWSYVTTSLPLREEESQNSRDNIFANQLITLFTGFYGTSHTAN